MDWRKFFPLVIFILIVLSSLIYAANRTEDLDSNIENYDSIVLSEIQISACSAAHIGGTCNTKLNDLDLVSSEDCCKALGKCC